MLKHKNAFNTHGGGVRGQVNLVCSTCTSARVLPRTLAQARRAERGDGVGLALDVQVRALKKPGVHKLKASFSLFIRVEIFETGRFQKARVELSKFRGLSFQKKPAGVAPGC